MTGWWLAFGAVVVLAAILFFGNWSFRHTYISLVKRYAGRTQADGVILMESDLSCLPSPIQNYIRLAGCVGKPKVTSFKVEFNGQLRQRPGGEWMPFRSVQYNFIEPAARLFFLNATMKHLPVAGLHCFEAGKAFMDIRLLSLIRVQHQTGHEMGIAETVTFFNDMCCMAPATLIDPRIKWERVRDDAVRGTMTIANQSISALLYFNEKGELINFISEDRYATDDKGSMRRLTWSTPLSDYKDVNGFHLAGAAEARYQYPEGDFCYGTFQTKSVRYNPTVLS